MIIILDENVPNGVRHMLVSHTVMTVHEAGYDGMKNGQLLSVLDGNFDVLITADKNLRYQQNLDGRRLGIVELPTNRWPLLRSLESEIVAAVERCGLSDYIVVGGS
jgi:hypothetical protein